MSRDDTIYDGLRIPEKFSGADIAIIPLYNIESPERMTLYGCEFYRQDELIGFAHYRMTDMRGEHFTTRICDIESGQLTEYTVDFEFNRYERTWELVRDTNEILNVDFTYNQDTHEITYVDSEQISSLVNIAEIYHARNSWDEKECAAFILPVGETPDDIRERLTTTGDAFKERCIHLSKTNITALHGPEGEIRTHGCGKPSGLWCSVADKTKPNEISQWTSHYKYGLDGTTTGTFIATFNLSSDARVCLCRGVEDIYKMASVYPKNFLSSGLGSAKEHLENNIVCEIPIAMNFTEFVKDYDVLIVDTRDTGSDWIWGYDIHTSVVVFNPDVVENFECIPIEEYVSREGIEDYEYEYDDGYDDKNDFWEESDGGDGDNYNEDDCWNDGDCYRNDG